EYFDQVGTLTGSNPYIYQARFHTHDQLSYASNEFTLVEPDGTRTRFYDFSTNTASLPAIQRGQFKVLTDPGGHDTTATYFTSGDNVGRIWHVDRDGGNEQFIYTYMSDNDANA